ncbi:MAG: hypothetical protein JWN22_2131 [Nocardioides sp.]|jgi:hypothetical protein|nr:hypothetical protein [Nocardioides sp.]
MGDVSSTADRLGRRADGSDWLDHAIRIGLMAYGVVHLMIAWLALQLAFGDSSGSASSKGAMQQLAKEPFGEVLIWLIAVGMFLLVVWRLVEAAAGHRDEDGGKRLRKRLTSLGKAVIYGSIGVSALRVAMGSGSSSKGQDSTTARLMDLPAGRWIVALVGIAIIGYGLNLGRRALTEKFREHLTAEGKSGDAGQAYIWFGKAGYLAKGVAFLVVGGLFVYAAYTHEAKKSGGLDQALHKVLQQPFGQVLLVVLALGIACYGLFCFARARHLSR